MDRVVQISEARAQLGDLVVEAAEREVYILKHGRPAAVLLSVEVFERLQDRMEDLEDEVSVLRSRLEPDLEPFDPTADLDQGA